MAKADGSILIDTKINEDGFEAGSKDLELAARRVAKSLTDLGGKARIALQKQVDSFAKLNNQYAQQEKKVEALKKELDNLNEQKLPTQQYKDVEKEIGRLNTALDKAIERQIKFVETGGNIKSRAFSAMEYDIEKINASLNEANARKTQLESSGGAYRMADTSGAEEKLNAEKEKLDELNKRLNTSYMSLKQSVSSYGGSLDALRVQTQEYVGIVQVLKNALDIIINAFLSIPSAIKNIPQSAFNGLVFGARKLSEGLKTVVKRLRDAAIHLTQMAGKKILSGLKKISAGILGINKSSNKATFGLRRMITTGLLMSVVYRAFSAITNGIKEGFQNLAQYSDETNSSLSILMSSLTRLKNSLATAFSPILTAVTPALNYLINMLTEATNAVGRLIAVLTGKGYFVQATKVQQDYAASLKGTGDAASSAGKDAKKALAPFDDLVQIQRQEDTGSSGGGSGELSPDDMFETVEIEPISFDSWGQAFDAFLSYLLNSGIPALKGALSEMASWINSFSSNLYEMFTFPGVREKVQQLGKEIGNALNDFTNQIDWATVGKALGSGLDLAIQFLVEFIYTYDWINLGESLAEAINNAIEQIDWYAFGQLLWAKFKIALETFAGFFTGLDMPQLAQAGSNIAIGLFNSITETLQNIDWQGLGKQIADFIANIDYAGIADAFFYGVGAALASLAEFLIGLIGGAWSSATKWWNEVAYEDGKFTIDGLLQGILDALAGIGQWIAEHVFTPINKGFKDSFGIHSPSTVMAELGGDLIEGLVLGIQNFIFSVVEKFEEIKTNIIQKWEETKKETKEKWDSIKNNLIQTWENLKQNAQTKFTEIKNGIQEKWQNVKGDTAEKWESIKSNLSETWENVRVTASNKFSEVRQKISDAWQQTKQDTSEKWRNIKTELSTTWDSLKEKSGTTFDDLKKGVISAWETLKGKTKEIWDGIVGIIKGCVNGVVSAIEGMVNSVIDAVNWVIRQINKISIDVPDTPFSDGFSIGFDIPTLDKIELPRLASGTVIPPRAGEFAAILGDNKQETEVVSPLSTMKQAFKEALRESGGFGGAGEIVGYIYLDGKELGRSTVQFVRQEKKRTGRNPVLV